MKLNGAIVFILMFVLQSCGDESREELEVKLDNQTQFTYETDVRPIVSEYCLNCHSSPTQNDAPFSLVNFEQVKNRATNISNSINGRTILMPIGRVLSGTKINIIDAWIDQGLIEK